MADAIDITGLTNVPRDELARALIQSIPPAGQIEYVNLTNGLIALSEFGRLAQRFRFIRIQSTHCEQKLWQRVWDSVSDDFLLHAALGHRCIVYDYGARKQVPRAIWQGLEFVRCILAHKWHNHPFAPTGRVQSAASYFEDCAHRLDLSRADYFRRFVSGPLRIESVTSSTDRDGDYGYFVDLARKSL